MSGKAGQLFFDAPPAAHNIETAFVWLERYKLTCPAPGFQEESGDRSNDILPQTEHQLLGLPVHRVRSVDRSRLGEITRERGRPFDALLVDSERIWSEIRIPGCVVRVLDEDRVPADAMAFYRPFHFTPHSAWGIYLRVDRLLSYCQQLRESLGRLASFPPETIAACVVFEIFHHEFFHHMAESAATTIEILLGGIEKPRAMFLDYWSRRNEGPMGGHPHAPLEEALANAYAYNSFSFLSRVKFGYRSGTVKLYQNAIERYWRLEPPGYRDAAHYVDEAYIAGGAQLLAMLLGGHHLDDGLPLELLSNRVIPRGFTAFLSKPAIPTYLVGDHEQLRSFYELVPAPNETYTRLFWPGDTTALDVLLLRKRDEEKRR